MCSIASLSNVPTARAVNTIRMSSYIAFLKQGNNTIPSKANRETITIAIVPKP